MSAPTGRTRRARRRLPARTALLASAIVGLGACAGGSESTVTISSTPIEREIGDLPVAPSAGSTMLPETPNGTTAPGELPAARVLEVAASELSTPWGIDFFNNGDALVTERDTTRILRVTGSKRVVQEVGTVNVAAPGGEGGLLGVEIDPDFSDEVRWVYFYVTTAEDNRVVRAELTAGVLDTPEVILEGIPRGFVHNGGRLVFGPDGYLYVGTGDAGDPDLAQDPSSLAGKILRITADGDPAPDNPSDSPVYSLGHSNVQGLAFDGRERLWATDTGGERFDELNLVEPGGNYGWPELEGAAGDDAEATDFVDPRQDWSPSTTGLGGLAFADGALWLGALEGRQLWRVEVEGDEAVDPEPFLVDEYGRLRSVATSADGTVWVTTSNRDGNGKPSKVDDRILRVQP